MGTRLTLEGETEKMGVGAKTCKGMKTVIIMATPCTKSLGGGSGGHKMHVYSMEAVMGAMLA